MKMDNDLRVRPDQQQLLKKSILWNIVEPGDPYDIKKSTIARLPGDSKAFMGNKLELVCLMQAAQIERLAINLEQYRVKFHEVQKSTLDRHSYEVQIKQLASRLQGQEALRTENTKLKKFSERLNQQLEQTKQKHSSGNSQLNTNYQQALLQVQNYSQHNQQLTAESNHLKELLALKTIQCQELRGQVQSLKQSLEEAGQNGERVEQYELKFSILGEEIKRLNAVLKTKSEENFYLTEEIKQSKNYMISKKEENQQLQTTQNQMEQQIDNLKRQLARTAQEQLQYQTTTQYIEESKSKLEQAGAEVARLTQLLTQAQQDNQSLRNTVKETEKTIADYSMTLNQKNNAIEELQTTNYKYESNSALIAKEVERLNLVIKTKVEEAAVLQSRLARAAEQSQFYSTQLATFEQQNKENKQLKSQLQSLQLQISNQQTSTSKLTKTNTDLLKRINELSLQRQKQSSQQQLLTKKTEQLKELNTIVQTLENQIKQYQLNLKQHQLNEGELQRANKELAELKNIMLQEDNNKKNLNMRINEMNKQNNQYQRVINQLTNEVNKLNNAYKLKTQSLNELEAKNNNHHKVIEEYQNKFALISLEIERLNQQLRDTLVAQAQQAQANQSLKAQTEQYKSQLTSLSNSLQHTESKQQQKLIEYQNQIYRLNQVIKVRLDQMQSQNYTLKQQSKQLMRQNKELKTKIGEYNNQKEKADLERLNNLLRLKVEEASKWEQSNQELVRKIQYMEDNMQQVVADNHNLKIEVDLMYSEKNITVSQLEEYKVKVQHILQEVQRLHQILDTLKQENTHLKQENAQLKQENGQLKNSTANPNLKQKNERLLKEIERLNIIIVEQNQQLKQLRTLLTQDFSLDKRIKEQLSLIVVLFAEIETLRRRIDDKEKQIQVVRRQSLVALKD